MPPPGLHRFIVLHTIAIVLHLFCAVYAFASSAAYTTPIRLEMRTVTYPTPPLHSVNASYSYYYTDAAVTTFDGPSVAQVHGIVAIVTIIMHLFVYLPVHLLYAANVWNQAFFAPRWIEYAISCTLMSLASSATAGARDVNNLITLALVGILIQAFGCLIEQFRSLATPLFTIGSLLNLAASYSTLWYLFSSFNDFSWIQSLEVVAYAFFYGLFPLNCIIDARYRPNFQRTEWIYNSLSLTSKFGLFWLQVGEVERVVYDSHWSYVQIWGLGIAIPCLMLCVAAWLAPARPRLVFDTNPNPPFPRLRRLITSKVATLPSQTTPCEGHPVMQSRSRRFDHVLRARR